ncbi:MAG TPA: hypothetical protein VFP21_12445, partial [Solirubrobacterales bacterium]|nr:hypothetical protein [Solirubrobacterales bacterium]
MERRDAAGYDSDPQISLRNLLHHCVLSIFSPGEGPNHGFKPLVYLTSGEARFPHQVVLGLLESGRLDEGFAGERS